MKKILTISKLILLFCSFDLVAEERFYDVFMGMLQKNDRGELIFMRCGQPASPMRFELAHDAEQETVDKLLKAVDDNEDKPVYIHTTASVNFLDQNEEYSNVIYVKSVNDINVDANCHLTGFF